MSGTLRRRSATSLSLLLASLVVLFATTGASPTESLAANAKAKQCPAGTVRAVVAGNQTCLKAGQRCTRSLDRQYHRYGFHCHGGRLTRAKPAPPAPRFVTLEVAGSPEVVFDWTTDRCDEPDIPDLPARVFRDADGNVQLISTHYINRRFVGPDVDHLSRDCAVIMSSGLNPDPAAFDDQEWISSTWTPDGRTIYALIHNEYNGTTHPGQCASGQYLSCWWNVITLAISRDGGQTYSDQPWPKLVASVPYRYVPDSGTFGAQSPSNIVHNDRDGYYYALVYVKQQPAGQPPAYSVNCLIRTTDLGDPSSWRAWSGGKRFDTTFIDPYRSTAEPGPHLCRGVSPGTLGEFVPGSLTYNSVARQWLYVGVRAGGFYYSLSPDLINWTVSQLFYPAEVGWTYQCGDADPVHYPSLIDPRSTSRNFETSGSSAYLYFTQFHTESCQQGLDRDLVRISIRIRP